MGCAWQTHRAGTEAAAAGGAGSVSGPFCPQPANPMMPTANNPARSTPAQQATTLGRRVVFDMRTILAMASQATPLTDREYHARAAAVLASVEATIDRWLQQDVIDIDTQRTGGLLELTFPDDSRIVINTQPPLHELWLATRAGGYHYRFVDGRWLDTKNDDEFFESLSKAASEQGGRPLRFDAPASA
jgi:CyaY protein